MLMVPMLPEEMKTGSTTTENGRRPQCGQLKAKPSVGISSNVKMPWQRLHTIKGMSPSSIQSFLAQFFYPVCHPLYGELLGLFPAFGTHVLVMPPIQVPTKVSIPCRSYYVCKFRHRMD